MTELCNMLTITLLCFVMKFAKRANFHAKTIIIHLLLPRVTLRSTRGYKHLTPLVSRNAIETPMGMLSSLLYSAPIAIGAKGVRSQNGR